MAVGGGLAPAGAHASGLSVVAPAAATTSSGTSPATTASEAGSFTSLAPARVLDTRSNLGGPGPVASGGVVHLHVLGRGGVPASGVSAVVLNVTVVYPKAPGFVTVWPDGAARPTASNLNFAAGQTVANLVVAKVGADGAVSMANSSAGTVQLVADVAGYYLAGTPSAAGMFASLAPARVLDTRSNLGAPGPVASGGVVHLHVLGQGGVPASGASAVVLNVTVVYPKAPGFVTVWPDGAPRPTASNLNFVAGQTVANLVVAEIGTDGSVALANSSGSTIQLVADVAGRYLSHDEPLSSVTAAKASTASPTSMALSWTNPPTGPFTGVVIRRGMGATPPATATDGTAVTTTTGGVTRFTDAALTAGDTYSYALFATDGTNYAPPATLTVTAGSLTWSSPQTIDRNTGHPSAVSCPTATFCAAVDEFGNAMTFNGSAWSAPTIVGPGLHFASVSCPTASFCVAAGQGGGIVEFDEPLTHGSYRNIDFGVDLTSVSCPTTTFCAAVDRAGNAVTFDGQQRLSLDDIDGTNRLTSVSCPSASFCAAVDDSGNAMTFNGVSWSAPTSIDSAKSLTSVSCPTSSFCAAVDTQGDVLSFGGTAWSAPVTVDGTNRLQSVSCSTTSSCIAVDSSGRAMALMASGWSAPTTVDSAGLVAVSCPATSFCVAVDGAADGSEVTFDGSTWSSPRMIDPYDGRPTGVSCPTATFCAAVDDGGNVMLFNGSSWSAPAKVGAELRSVSCASTTFCAAVDGRGRALTFDGTSWSSPIPVLNPGDLFSISCPSASFCAATDTLGRAVTFDGASWSAPTDIDGSIPVMSVSCPTTTFCAAVDTSGQVLTFDGRTWGAPQPIDVPQHLVSVSCASAAFCVAGDYVGNVVTMEGSSWSAPHRVTTNTITSVSCPTTAFCAALDQYGNELTFNGSTWSTPTLITTMDGLNSISCPTVLFCAAVESTRSSAMLGVMP